MTFYHVLNYFFYAFHTSLVLFNALGWIFKRTRKWNLITLTATAFSWFVLGIWYGWGYCVFTQWHWDVLEKLGYYDLPNSYIQFLIFKLTGMSFNASSVDTGTAIVFFFSLFMSILFNFSDYRKIRKRNNVAL